ncbi:NK-tumor recognition protein isoform X2 [Bombina bombina]|uniref:NK-tumor recognition protein isoform X2 n=1 Tax=Bombina bombina TaxID=8345 RepID=UPI00235A901A|nr:NK-tumor recognition protein isoform X2 [Bombina bombina]
MGEKARPQCYFELEINREPVGRIVFQLFSDVCPETCQNFLCLCTGEKGTGKVTEKKLWYKGSTFHRVVKNFMIQGGDFSEGNGKGGESIYGGYFKDENFILKHDRAFLLSMANRGKHTNGSQFFITTKAAPHLDGIHVVFGLVISGFEVIEKIEHLKTDAASRPYADVRVTDCGILGPKQTKDGGGTAIYNSGFKEKAKRVESQSEESESSSKSSSPTSSWSSESSFSESEIERNKRKKRKSRTKVKHSKRKRKEPHRPETKKEQKPPSQHSVQSENSPNEDKQGTKREKPVVRPEEIPPVPENRFLLRRDAPVQKPEPELKPRNVDSEKSDHQTALLSKSGRKIRGRGTIRYHTPPRSRSCTESEDNEESSETPPHWKEEMQRLKTYRPPSVEKWSKGDKLNDRLSSRWDEGSLSSRSSSWSHDGYHSASKNRKKEKKVKHKKKSKKRHSKKLKPPKEESLHSKSRKQTNRSSSVLSRDSSKKNWSVSDKEHGSSVHSSKESHFESRSRSYSRDSFRSRSASISSSRSRSRSRNRSKAKSRSKNRARSRSRSESHSHSSKSKNLKPVPQSPKKTVLPTIETKAIASIEPVKTVVNQTDKPVLPPVVSEIVPVMPLSDSPPPSRWKPGQKPWKPSYERIQEIKAKTSYNLTKSRNALGETKTGSYRKRQLSSDSEHSNYSDKSFGYRRKSKMRSRSRSYSRSYSRSRSRSSASRTEINSHSYSSSSGQSSSDDSNDSSQSRRSFLKEKVESKQRKASKSPNQSQAKQKSISPSSSKSDSDSSSDHEDNKEMLKTIQLMNVIKNHIEDDKIQDSNVDKKNSQQLDSDTIKQEEVLEKEKLVEQVVNVNDSMEKPMLNIPLENISDKNQTVNANEDVLMSSGKEEGEASSETDTEEINQSKDAVLSPNMEKDTKSPPSGSSSQEKNKSKAKKHKHRSSKKMKKNLSKKGKEKSKKKKEKKHKDQKQNQTFHWQPPLEFGEEEDDDNETVKPNKNKAGEKQDMSNEKSSGDIFNQTAVTEKTVKEKEKSFAEQDKSQEKVEDSVPLPNREKSQAPSNTLTSTTVEIKKINTSIHLNQAKESISSGKSQASTVNVASDHNSPASANKAHIVAENVKEEKSLSNPLIPNNTPSVEKVNPGNSDTSAAENKWKPVQGSSILQTVKSSNIPLILRQENKSQGLRIEIKSKNKVKPGSLFDEVRKTARLNQRPRNKESSSEEFSSSDDEKSQSKSQTRSRSKSRSVSRHRKSSRSYSRSRSRSSSYSSSSRSRSYSRSRSRRSRRSRTRSRSRSYGSYRSYRTYSRSHSRSSYDRRRRSRSRSYTSYYSRSRSCSRSPTPKRSRSYYRRSRSRRSYASDSGSDRSHSRHRHRSKRS